MRYPPADATRASSIVLSTPIRLMARPFRGYRALANEAEPPSVALGVGRFLFVIGVLVTTTATGRFAPLEAAFAMVAYAWLPLMHAVAMLVSLRALAKTIPFGRAFGLYLESLGPWLVAFLGLSGACLFAAQPAKVVLRALAPILVVAAGWSVVLLFALFREGLSLGRGRAAAAVALFYVVFFALFIGYFFAAGQLWPIL